VLGLHFSHLSAGKTLVSERVGFEWRRCSLEDFFSRKCNTLISLISILLLLLA